MMKSLKAKLIAQLNSYIGSKIRVGLAPNSLNFTFDNDDFIYTHPLWRYEYKDKVIMSSYDFLPAYPKEYPEDLSDEKAENYEKEYYEHEYKIDFNTRCTQLQVFNHLKLENYKLSNNLDLTLIFSNNHVIRQFHANTLPAEPEDDDISLLSSGWIIFTDQVTFQVFADKIINT